jgi:hypothetical protein
MDFLNAYSSIQDNQECLLSVYIYKQSVSSLLPLFEKELEKAKQITNSLKRKKINNAYFSLVKKYRELDENTILSELYFIQEDTFLVEHQLSPDEEKVIQEYHLRPMYYQFGQTFHISYFQHLFYNFDFIYVAHIQKNHCTWTMLNKTKSKKYLEKKISSLEDLYQSCKDLRKDKNYQELIIIHGNSPLLSKWEEQNITLLFQETISNEELNKHYENYCIQENLNLLEKKLDELQDSRTNTDLYIFGRLKIEIKEAVESYILKELYIEQRKIELLKNCVEDHACFNFKIIPIESLKEGDIGEKFIKEYKGLMGIKYF